MFPGLEFPPPATRVHMSLATEWVCRQQYARVFQRLCRGPERNTPAQRCFATSRRRYNGRSKPHPGEDEINLFEQDFVRTASGEMKILGPATNVQERIRRLEDELKDLKAGSFAVPDEFRTSDADHGLDAEAATLPRSRWNGQFMAKDDEGILDDGKQASDRLQATRLAGESPEVGLQLPYSQRKSLERLNGLLRRMHSGDRSFKLSRSLWQQYSSSKDEVPGLLRQLPKSAWRILWDSQYDSKILNNARSKHIWTLAEDLVHAGQSLTAEQKMARVEARYAAAKYDEALALWSVERTELGSHTEVSDAFWSLGTRVRVALDGPDQGMQLAMDIAHDFPRAAVSSFLPVIEAYLRAGDEASIQKAAAGYFRIRIALQDAIVMDDLDRITMCFLKGGQPDLAVGVFKDMVSAEPTSQHELESLRRRSVQLVDKFQIEAGTDGEHSNQVTLKILQFLPRRFQNKFFYASWLKRLIGMGELEAAHQVLELMYHRGVRPDALHLNGLLSAWLRRGTPYSKRLALELGKGMVQARLNFVAARRAGHISSPGPLDPSALLPPYLGRNLPSATIETFSILLLHYEQSNMPSSMAHLQETLHLAELQPNIFFVNHSLHAHLRTGEAGAAWKLYCATIDNQLRPDLHTFGTLWDVCKSHAELHNTGHAQLFPSPRALFGHMSAWLARLPAKEAAAARELTKLKQTLHAQIFRCMCLARDLRGALVALYALRDMLGALPDPTTARIVAVLIARMGEPIRSPRRRLHDGTLTRQRRSVTIRQQTSQANYAQIERVLERLAKERQMTLSRQGVAMEELSDQQKGEELLWLLAKVLKDSIDAHVLARAELHQAEVGEEQPSDPMTLPTTQIKLANERLEEVAFQMGAGSFQVTPPSYERDGG